LLYGGECKGSGERRPQRGPKTRKTYKEEKSPNGGEGRRVRLKLRTGIHSKSNRFEKKPGGGCLKPAEYCHEDEGDVSIGIITAKLKEKKGFGRDEGKIDGGRTRVSLEASS